MIESPLLVGFTPPTDFVKRGYAIGRQDQDFVTVPEAEAEFDRWLNAYLVGVEGAIRAKISKESKA